MCTVKCPLFRNVTLTYKIQPRDGVTDVSYNVLCNGCNSTLGGIKDQFQTQVIFCQGGLVDNKLYEIEVSTEDGHKGYSTIAVMTESEYEYLYVTSHDDALTFSQLNHDCTMTGLYNSSMI